MTEGYDIDRAALHITKSTYECDIKKAAKHIAESTIKKESNKK